MNGAALVVGVPECDYIKGKLSGTISDVKKLHGALTNLGFDVTKLQDDLTNSIFDTELDKAVKNAVTTGKEYFVLTISAHGSEFQSDSLNDKLEHFVCFKDKERRTQTILDLLDRDDMKDVVKIILIAACRSRDGPMEDNVDFGLDMQIVDDAKEEYKVTGDHPRSASTLSEKSCTLPNLPRNSLIWFASPSGKYDYEQFPAGSFFVEHFCKEMEAIPPEGRLFTDVVCRVHSSLAMLENKTIKLEKDKPKVTWKTVPSLTHNLCSNFHFKMKYSQHCDQKGL